MIGILNSTVGRLGQSLVCTVQSCKTLHPHHNLPQWKCCLQTPILSVMPRMTSSIAQQEQPQLPHLPVPPLQQTLEKFLTSVRPCVSSQEFEATRSIVSEFGSSGGIGEILQKLLIEKAHKTENWLSDWWLEHSYLGFRWPVVIYSSPGMVMPKVQIRSTQDRVSVAARIILACLDYKIAVDEGRLPQEMMGKAFLDMSQHGKMLGTCRVPGLECDNLIFSPPELDLHPRHIVVAHNDHFFKVDVYDSDGLPYSENVMVQLLTSVLSQSTQPAEHPVGILTSETRDNWGRTYKHMRTSKLNADSMSQIQKSLFLVCIDRPNAQTDKDSAPETTAAKQMIHGGGSQLNSGNRWFDKTVQFVIGTDGEVGITYEHSPAEGPPIAALSDHAVDFLQEKKRISKFSSAESAMLPPLHLEFEISSTTLNAIKEAKMKLDSMVADLDMSCFAFHPYGKNFIKSQKLSPDSYLQMSFQLAFFRLHGIPGATYETASTRQYKHGRTETIRSTSVQALAFCKTMLDSSASVAEKTKALHDAINVHKQYVMEAIRGFGVDRHLLGLKLIAIENGIAIPKLYEDKGYVKSSQFRMSTSQVAARHRSFMCYGPLVTDGYGCCYNPRDNDMIFGLSAYNSCKDTSASAFRDALHKSLVDMHDVLLQGQKSKL